MIAMLAYGISLKAADADGAVVVRSLAAGAAGQARMTASASRYSGSAAEPMVSRHPDSVLASWRTVALVRISAPEALAILPGSHPSPVGRGTNNGAGLSDGSAGRGGV